MALSRALGLDMFDYYDSRFNNLVRDWEDHLGVQPASSALTKPDSSSLFRPAIDYVEKENEIVVHTELPGISKDQLKVEVVGNQLVVAGETSDQNDHSDGQWKIRERSYGKFERRVNLPKSVDTEQVNAKFENGLLEVKIPKKPVDDKANRKLIAIQ